MPWIKTICPRGHKGQRYCDKPWIRGDDSRIKKTDDCSICFWDEWFATEPAKRRYGPPIIVRSP